MTLSFVEGGTAITVDADRRVLPNTTVAIRNGTIVGIGDGDAMRREHGEPDDLIDAAGAAVLPGFVNGHTHGCMLYGRTLGADREFTDWFARTQLPIMSAMEREDFFLAELLTMVENLLEGNTTVLENSFFPRDVRRSGTSIVVDAARASGIRAVIADAYLTSNSAANFLETPDEVIDRHTDLINNHHRSGLLSVALSPLLPWATTPADLQNSMRLCRDSGVMLHAHCAETPHYNERSVAVHGARSNVDFLLSSGALGPNVQLVGCSEADAEDLIVIAQTGTRVISVPTSDLYQSHRLTSLADLRSRGIPISVASNGCAGNGGQSMFDAMRDGVGIAKALAVEPVMGVNDALELATIDAARNLGIDDLVGSLEIGKRGDVIVIDLHRPHVAPALNVPAAVAYSCRGSDVRHVLVDGNVVVRGGQCMTVDVPALVGEVLRRASGIAASEPDIGALACGLS
ncbi:amidohydrolase family protein [Gemmatimonas sp.]|uniref:amidohydrolase family protein n=1 Tax=Gemmatimonas sp. TaxID=1962908 RepID=UPI0035698BFE